MAAGLLIVGLLVLIPEPVRGAQPSAPTVVLSDIGSATDNNIRTTLTTVVTIPQGKVIPLEFAQIVVADGTLDPAFANTVDAPARMNANLVAPSPCAATIVSWGGATEVFGVLDNVPGYSIIPAGYGYGYTFGTPFDNDVLSSYNSGYGYGSTTADLHVTVTVQADNCPSGSAFTTTLRPFYMQVVVGANANEAFASVPTLVTLRDPEAAAPVGTGAISVNAGILDGGAQTTFNLQVQAGATLDGADSATGSTTYTPPLGDQTTLTQAVISTNQAVPEGATLSLSFTDLLGQTGASFPAGSTSFGIPAGDLGTRTAGAPLAGFFSITMNGLPAGTTGGAFLDIVVTLDVPQSYFTGGRTVGNFHLERYSDAGVFQSVVTCSGGTASTTQGPGGTDVPTFLFTCTITDFSSFAMVSSAFSVGGGGGGGGATTTSTATSSLTNTATTTSTVSQTGTETQTSTQSLSGSTTNKAGRGGSAPSLEFGLLVAALAGMALLARRQLK